jgi:hypothetical protein
VEEGNITPDMLSDGLLRSGSSNAHQLCRVTSPVDH